MNKDEAREAAIKKLQEENYDVHTSDYYNAGQEVGIRIGFDAGVASVDRRAIVSELKRKVTMMTALLTGEHIADNQHRLGLIGSINIDEACRILQEMDAVLASMGGDDE